MAFVANAYDEETLTSIAEPLAMLFQRCGVGFDTTPAGLYVAVLDPDFDVPVP